MPSIWKDRTFLWFASGQTLAQFGAAVALFAIPWMLLQQTGSAAGTGLAFAVGFIPYLTLSLPAGVWADRISRSRMMIAADLGRLLTMAALPLSYALTGATPVWLLFAVQAVLSAFAAIFDAAYGAYLPQIVSKEQLSGANSALQSGTSLSQVMGPALGGTLLSWLGGHDVLLLTAGTYLLSILSIFGVRGKERPQPPATARRNLRKEIAEGFSYVWQHRLIRATGVFAMLANLVIPATSVALLYKLQKELALDAGITGMILGGWSLGMVVGSLLYGKLKQRFAVKTILTGSILLAILPPIVLTSTSELVPIAAAHMLAGFAISLWNIPIITLRQSIIPGELMGRALTSIRLVAWCSLPVGNLLGGAMAQTYGTSSVFLYDLAIRLLIAALSVYLFRLMSRTGTKAAAGTNAAG